MLRSYFCASTLLGIFLLPLSAHAQTVLETSQQTNDRIRSLSSRLRTTQYDYVIGDGDLLNIQIFDVPELSRELRVSQTGTIGIPLLPVRLLVSGLTEIQTEQKIAEVLEANGLVSHPQVAVSVKERKSKPITIVGAVVRPMVYEADHPVSLLEALAQAGGISNDAGDTVIVTRPESQPAVEPGEPPMISFEDAKPPVGDRSAVTKNVDRSAVTKNMDKPVKSMDAVPAEKSTATAPTSVAADPKAVFSTPETLPAATPAAAGGAMNEPPPISNTLTVNLIDLMEVGDAKNNILLQAGDIVTVPHAGIIYALGAVGRPGGFVVANDRAQLTLLKILALAGGLTRTAKQTNAVIIRKDSIGKQSEVQVDLKKVLNRQAEDVQLRPSDILYVPDSGTKQALYRVMDIGVAVATSAAIYRTAYH